MTRKGRYSRLDPAAVEHAAQRSWIAVQVGTTNDTNGNPRRGWIVFDFLSGMAVDFVDEGHQGRGALDLAYPYLRGRTEERLEITPAQYRELKRGAR